MLEDDESNICCFDIIVLALISSVSLYSTSIVLKDIGNKN